MKKFNKKGFTLVEMLVVIAIIAVLVSIVIPTVSNSTEKAAEAADAANIRAAIAEATMMGLQNSADATSTTVVTIKQSDNTWDHIDEISGKTPPAITSGSSYKVSYDYSEGTYSLVDAE